MQVGLFRLCNGNLPRILWLLELIYFYWKLCQRTLQTTLFLLAKEYFNYVAGDGMYKNLSAKDAFLLLVERVENAIESENASTLNVMTTLSEAKTAKPNREKEEEN